MQMQVFGFGGTSRDSGVWLTFDIIRYRIDTRCLPSHVSTAAPSGHIFPCLESENKNKYSIMWMNVGLEIAVWIFRNLQPSHPTLLQHWRPITPHRKSKARGILLAPALISEQAGTLVGDEQGK
jgi:hypothetical protein